MVTTPVAGWHLILSLPSRLRWQGRVDVRSAGTIFAAQEIDVMVGVQRGVIATDGRGHIAHRVATSTSSRSIGVGSVNGKAVMEVTFSDF